MFSWFRKKKPEQPVAAPQAAPEMVRGDIGFANGERSWTEKYDVVEALCDARPGLAPGWTPRVEDGARFLASRARAGDLALTAGAGDVDRGAALILDAIGGRS